MEVGSEGWGQTWLKEKGTQQKCQQTMLANEITTNVIQR